MEYIFTFSVRGCNILRVCPTKMFGLWPIDLCWSHIDGHNLLNARTVLTTTVKCNCIIHALIATSHATYLLIHKRLVIRSSRITSSQWHIRVIGLPGWEEVWTWQTITCNVTISWYTCTYSHSIAVGNGTGMYVARITCFSKVIFCIRRMKYIHSSLQEVVTYSEYVQKWFCIVEM